MRLGSVKSAAAKAGRRATGRIGKVRQQCAAIPVSQDADGQLRVLLVTSRETRRWVVPKGWPAAKLTLADAAAREAFEEAGVTGRIIGEAIGAYCYDKRLTAVRTITCEVAVFLLRVERQPKNWPEKGQRDVTWFTPAEAAGLVGEPGLAIILAGLSSLNLEEPRRRKKETKAST